MDKKAVAVITTLVVGFLGSTFLGALLNWPDAGAICAIATMGCFVLHAIGDKKEEDCVPMRGGDNPSVSLTAASSLYTREPLVHGLYLHFENGVI